MKFRTRMVIAVGALTVGLCLATPLRADDAPEAKPITTADLKGIAVPSQDDLAKGDPGGTLTGTVNDIVDGRPQGRSHHRRHRQPGRPEPHRDQLRLDAGHRLPGHVHAGRLRDWSKPGLCRAKNANHTMMMNFMVYGLACSPTGSGLRPPDGRRRRGDRQPGRPAAAQRRVHASRSSAKTGASSGTKGFFLVRPDATTSASWCCSCSRWCSWTPPRRSSRAHARSAGSSPPSRSRSFFLGAHHLPALRQLGLGRRLAVAARRQLRPRPRLLRLRRLGRRARGRRHHRAGRGA